MTKVVLTPALHAQTSGEIAVFPHIQKQLFTDWGYDIKQPGKAASLTNTIINRVFIEDGMTVLRIPIYARDGHPSEGVVTDATYTIDNDIIGAINRVRAIKPSVKLFASLRLEGPDTFLPWQKDASGKVDSAKLAIMYRDYLVYMQGKGLYVEFFGVDNEAEYNLGDITPEKYKNIVGRIKNFAQQGLFTVPSKFIAAENYGPGNATTFVNTLNSSGWRNTMDIGGTHYYPHLRPLTNLTNFCNAVGSKPVWNTEIHWDSRDDVDDQLEAEEGLIAIFDGFDLGMTGQTWWSYGTSLSNYRSQMNRELVRSTNNSRPIDVDDVDGRTMAETTKLNTRAFRIGNTINIWINNYRNIVLNAQQIKLMSGTISGIPVYEQWINGALVTGNINATVTSPTTLTINIPASTFTLLTIQINPDPLPSFTAGNLLVVRSGYATNTLANNAEPVILDEYTKTGSFVQSRQLNTDKFLLSGNAINEGFGMLSQNAQFLAIGGYEAILEEQAVATTSASIVKRVVAVIDATGNVDYSTKFNTAFDGSFITGAVPANDGNKLWVAGNGNASTGGLYFISKGTTNAVKINGSNLRVPAIFGNQLYISSNSGTLGSAVRLGTVGIGLPETTATATNLPGADFGNPSVSGGVTISAFQYALLAIGGTTPNILYVANDGSNLPGIKKYALEAGSWNYKFTIGNGTNVYRGLAANIVGNNVELFAVADANKIMMAADVNALTNFTTAPVATTLINAPTNAVFKGISFTPGSNIVLPLNFLNILAVYDGGDVNVLWQTSNEINIANFTIEISSNGTQFSSVGQVKANNQSFNNYTFKVNNLQAGTYYFRVKEVDYNGKTSYSPIAKVAIANATNFSVYPIPAKNELTIVHTTATKNCHIYIRTIDGKIISYYNISEGKSVSKINLQSIANGSYIIQFVNNKNIVQKQFQKF